MTAQTRTPALCVTADWTGTETCRFVSGHDGPCSHELPQTPRPKCEHAQCYDREDGHWDFCMFEDDPYDQGHT